MISMLIGILGFLLLTGIWNIPIFIFGLLEVITQNVG